MVYRNLPMAGAGLGFAQVPLVNRYPKLAQVSVGLRLSSMPVWLVLHEDV